MINRTKIFIFPLAVFAALIFAAGDYAQASGRCTPPELANGTCTEVTYLDGTFTGYVVRLASGYPYVDSSLNQTKFLYNVSLQDGYDPYALSHVNLEFKICNGYKCSFESASGNHEIIPAGTGGDPSSGYGDDLASDIIKIDLGSIQSGFFFVAVYGKAYAVLGKIGFKAGTEIFVGEILQPVCSATCSTLTFSDFSGDKTLETEDGYVFNLSCNDSTGCCTVLSILKPDGTVKCTSDCTRAPISTFLATGKDADTFDVNQMTVVGGKACMDIVGNDTSDNSPWYCSGGYCYY